MEECLYGTEGKRESMCVCVYVRTCSHIVTPRDDSKEIVCMSRDRRPRSCVRKGAHIHMGSQQT